MPKIERKYMAHLVDASFGGDLATATWVRLGKDLEEYNVELNPDTESGRNILGETTFKHNGYEESSEADPFYADTDDPLFTKLQGIVDTRATGDACKTYALEVHMWGDSTSAFEAYAQECYIIPNSYGGDTSGYQIPFAVHYVGERIKGTYDATSREFTSAVTE